MWFLWAETRGFISEDGIHHSHIRENLNSYKLAYIPKSGTIISANWNAYKWYNLKPYPKTFYKDQEECRLLGWYALWLL
jgi:hypothetical protein